MTSSEVVTMVRKGIAQNKSKVEHNNATWNENENKTKQNKVKKLTCSNDCQLSMVALQATKTHNGEVH